MADLDPINITVKGTEKVIKSMQQIQAEQLEVYQSMQKINQAKFNGLEKEINELKNVINQLRNEAEKGGESLRNIDKNVKFATFKTAAKSVSTELVNLGATAVATGQSASEAISSIGGSLAGVAANFGPVGIGISAVLTVVTPLVASLFELSEAEKAVAAATDEYSKEVANNTVIVNDSFDTLKDNTSTYIEKKEAIDELQKILPGYLDELNAEGTSLERLNELQKISITLVRKLALEKIFAAKIAEQQAKRLEAEIKAEARFAKIKRDRIADGKTEAEADAIVSNVRINGTTVAYSEYLDILEETTAAITDLEAAQKGLNDQLEKSLTPQEAAALAKLQKGADGRARAADAQPFKPVELFADNYQDQLAELKDLLSKGLLSVEDFDKAVVKLTFTRDKYLASLAKDKDKAAALLVERNKIEEEIIKIDQDFQKNALFAIKFQEGTANAAGLTGEAFKEALNEIRNIAGAAQQGLITSGEAIDKFRALSFFNQSKGLQDLVKEYDKADKQIAQKTANLAIVQKKINDESNATFIREKIKTDKELAEIDSERINIIENEAKRNAQLQIAADDARGQQAILTFEDTLRGFNEAYKQSIIDFQKTNEASYATILSSNSKFAKDIFTQNADGYIEINEQAVIDLATTLSAADQKILDDRLTAAENLNTQLYTKQLQYNRERKELAEKFIKDNDIILKKFQSSEIEANLKRNNRTIEDNRYYQKLNSDDLKTIIEERRKSGKEQTKEEVAFIQTRLEQQLQLEEDSYKLRLESETKFDKERLARLRIQASGSPEALAEIVKLEEDIARKELILQRETTEAKVKINNEFYSYVDDAEAKRLKKQKEDADEEKRLAAERVKNGVAIVQQLQGFGNLLLDVINQQSQNLIDSLNEDLNVLEQRQVDVLNNISTLEDELEGKRSGRREAVLQALEQQKQIDKEIAMQKIRLAQEIEKEEIKIRKREQAAAIANAIINGAIAQTNIWATVPKADFGVSTFVLAGISAATTAAQIALIAGQKFADGGFTGDGTFKDETGHKVAGVVHDGEWVAPKSMVNNPVTAPLISQLESFRQNGFASGGFTTPDMQGLSYSLNQNTSGRIEAMLASYAQTNIMLANRPVQVSVTEFQSTADTVNRRMVRSRI